MQSLWSLYGLSDESKGPNDGDTLKWDLTVNEKVLERKKGQQASSSAGKQPQASPGAVKSSAATSPVKAAVKSPMKAPAKSPVTPPSPVKQPTPITSPVRTPVMSPVKQPPPVEAVVVQEPQRKVPPPRRDSGAFGCAPRVVFPALNEVSRKVCFGRRIGRSWAGVVRVSL